MKTNDLRIGNLVLNDDGGVCKLFNIHEGYINHKPIPLTEEWLLKFGFENGGYDLLFWCLGDFELAGNDFLNEGEETPEYAYNWYLEGEKHKQITINYVHQLQNLYWCLCGEELEVKQ